MLLGDEVEGNNFEDLFNDIPNQSDTSMDFKNYNVIDALNKSDAVSRSFDSVNETAYLIDGELDDDADRVEPPTKRPRLLDRNR